MEELRSLVSVVHKHKIKKIEILGTSQSSGDGKLYKLYDGIASGKIHSDEEAIKLLYTEEAAMPPGYVKLKQRLEKRLLNTLFFIDANEPSFSSDQSAFCNTYKNLAIIKILLKRNGRKVAIPLAEKILQKAMKFKITFVAFELANDLQIHYSTLEVNKSKRKKIP